MKKFLTLSLFLMQAVSAFSQPFNMGEAPSTSDCTGTLFDSGGPSGNYGSNENLTFTICPQDTHQCIFLHLVEMNTEENFDFLNVFAGPTIAAPQVASFTGFGNNLEVQIHSACVTLQFLSDFSTNETGFELTWMCSPDTCTVPPPSTCDDPTIINGLPFAMSGLTTCLAGDEISSSPCNNSNFLGSEDYVFTYTSPGNECIAAHITGSNAATGIGIYNDCPSDAGSQCIAQAGGIGQTPPSLPSVYLQAPGTYYLIVDNANACTPFNIFVEQVNCPVVFPSAALCENALSLNGCGDLPAIISVAPGQGLNGFIQNGINNGCWLTNFPLNFTWFFFEAQANGQFGFTMQAANPNETSDIDFQVWGPIDHPALACDFIQNNQPVRSSYAEGAEPTGLANFHPTLGTAVTDDCEGPGGDDFLKPLDVEEGKFYYVLINDWGNQIVSGAVFIDFSESAPGVLDAQPVSFSVTNDTSVCKGESIQLLASGGEVYKWFPADGLSCTDCSNPVLTIDESSIRSVIINSVCAADTLQVFAEVVESPQINIIGDTTVCPGDSISLNPAPDNSLAHTWTSSDQSFGSNAVSPVVSPISPVTYYVTVDNGVCPPVSDSVAINLIETPTIQVSNDTTVCEGQPVTLVANAGSVPGIFHWQPGNGQGAFFQPDLQEGVNTFSVTFADSAGCFSLTETIEIEQLAGIKILEISSDKPDSVYLGTALTLMAVTSIPANSWLWSSGSTTDTAFVKPSSMPQNSYSVTVTDALGCTDSEEYTVTVLASRWDIPNVFTPNGDQWNQHFKVIIAGENIEVLSLKIWNRWGQIVYQELNGNTGWDGVHKNEPAPSDVYIYQVILQLPDGTEVKKSGDVTLLR